MARGEAVLVVDDEDRENEGDIIFAAQHSTPALMGWTIRHSSGVICIPMEDGAQQTGWPCRPWWSATRTPRARPTLSAATPHSVSPPASAPPTAP